MDSSSVVSIKEARSILGKDSEVLTDEEIIQLVINLDDIALSFIKGVKEGTINPPKTNP